MNTTRWHFIEVDPDTIEFAGETFRRVGRRRPDDLRPDDVMTLTGLGDSQDEADIDTPIPLQMDYREPLTLLDPDAPLIRFAGAEPINEE